MKLRILVKRFKNELNEPIVDFPKIIRKGDWIDLRSAKEVVLDAPQAGTLKGHDVKHRDVVSQVTYIPLGISMQLPDGFEAIVASRSHGPEKLGIVCANGIGVIDNSYRGNTDQWHYPAIPIRKTSIAVNSRICQFRIQLSQKATCWQKLKWLFTSSIELVEVDSLKNSDRGGLGTTGIN